ncbi:uncharacterized protein, partial [Dermacentor albipictus]|uniref:uncharacterized protein n=1 Tax=Dermacentor albipictus TaxID=60249 RepID=UPI0038FBEA41
MSAFFHYIYSSRLDQEPLGMYFSCNKQRGAWNNNPSAAQFHNTYRRQLGEPHVVDLTKVAQRKYTVFRLRALARRITDCTRGTYVRHTLTKQVLFAHQ